MKKSRRRYLSFHLHSDGPVIDDEKQLSNAIWKNLLSLYGEINAADSKLYLVSFDQEKGEGVLQCTLSSLEMVITSAVLIGSVGKTLVSFEPKRTSGTIKGLSR
ncbi:MAG: Rpp14/Pop5 family protein [Candidatus Thorarchaeota archaeon]|jgi:RNase P/RNase MRP subunit POP5